MADSLEEVTLLELIIKDYDENIRVSLLKHTDPAEITAVSTEHRAVRVLKQLFKRTNAVLHTYTLFCVCLARLDGTRVSSS